VRVVRIALTALAVALLLLTAPVGKPRADPVSASAVVHCCRWSEKSELRALVPTANFQLHQHHWREEKNVSANAEVPPVWATESVALADPDPAWTLRGEKERDQLETLLAVWLIARIEHVGSTSIPGLVAKPIIDLQALIADFADADSLAAALAPHDWHYVDPDLDHRPWRRFYVKVIDERRSAHLHVMTPDSVRWHQQIAFRDTLRADLTLVADYAALKRILAGEHVDDREAYSAAKADFIQSVLARST
jgi:GrpB-like predicted nucleotidyltransferase (UPF0157 family)